MEDNKNKSDLMLFQRNLNKQFLDIFENKKLEHKIEFENETTLGLIDMSNQYYFFFPLKSLKNISSDNKIEEVALTKPWILGFNQIYGEVYTITDFNRIIDDILIQENTLNNKKIITHESNILYLKNITKKETNVAVLIDKLSLKNIMEYDNLFTMNINQSDEYQWSVNEELVHHIDNSHDKLLSIIKENINKSWSNEEINIKIQEGNKEEKLFWIMISDVYWDKNESHPVFAIDVERLTKFLINVSPY